MVGIDRKLSTADWVFVGAYLTAIIGANGLVTAFGQPALLVTAFVLIPFDLVARDLLQDRWQSSSQVTLRLRMGALILGGSVISWVTTIGSLRIATASAIAFGVTGLLDAATYQWMVRRGRLFRINIATAIAALTDSIIFAVIAFDHTEGTLIVAQAGIKLAGGFCWSLALFRMFRSRAVSSPVSTLPLIANNRMEYE